MRKQIFNLKKRLLPSNRIVDSEKKKEWWDEGQILKYPDGRMYRVMKNGSFIRIKQVEKKKEK